MLEKIESKVSECFISGNSEILKDLFDIFGGITKAGKIAILIKEKMFLTKLKKLILGLKEINREDKAKFCEQIREKTKGSDGLFIITTIEHIENIKKVDILTNLCIAAIKEQISIDDFFRLVVILERIPYTDIENIRHYENPIYEPGITEILFAAGAIKLTTIYDNEENRYSLNSIGKKFLEVGLGISIYSPIIPGSKDKSLDFYEGK